MPKTKTTKPASAFRPAPARPAGIDPEHFLSPIEEPRQEGSYRRPGPAR